MYILIANPGSTSYKCKLLDMNSLLTIFQAVVERIGEENSSYSYQFENEEIKTQSHQIPDYFSAIHLTLETLQSRFSIKEISAIGFKVVLAKDVTGCGELTDEVLKAMEEFLPLAPVHNQIYLTAIKTIKTLVSDIPLVGLFETAFHTKIPPEAYLYGIPYEYYEKYGIRKYGFHGASHRYIANYVQENFANNEEGLKIISCHLGGSSSVCAIRNGISVDTSMGMSPQSGLLNAKRVGDLDSFALLYLMERENLSIEQARELLIAKGGVFGISGLSGDFRDIEKAMDSGNTRATLAFKTFAYVVKRYIGEYLAVLNGADYIIFTGGLGQYSPRMRLQIISDMENLGIKLDQKKNEKNPEVGIISTDDSSVKIAVIPTNEELIVAREVQNFILKKS